MKKTLHELKDFMFRGNVIDMAIGVVIGTAFSAIVKSLVDDIIMPVIGLVTGGTDFTNLFISFDGTKYDTLAAAKEAGAATWNYGSFITQVINFVLIAVALFFFMKAINNIIKKLEHKKEEAPAAPKRTCPYCFGELNDKATRCPHCTSDVSDSVVE